jgi:hypothetical protein
MTHIESQLPDKLKAIDRKRSWIVLTSVLALVVLAVALFRAPAQAVVVVTLIILVSLKKAAIRYRALGERKTDLLHDLSSEKDTNAPRNDKEVPG